MTSSTATSTTTSTSSITSNNNALLATSVVHHPVNIIDIIPNWTNNKLFSSTTTSELPRRISVLAPSSDTDIKIKKRLRPKQKQTTVSISTVTAASTHLGSKLIGDAMVATGVTFCVSPFLTVVDKAIVESAAGSNTIIKSGINSIKSMARNPVEYIKSPTFLLMWAVYSATYTTANAFKTLEEHVTYSNDRSSSLSSSSSSASSVGDQKQTTTNNLGMFKLGAFVGTTVVNSGTSMMKDRAYARMFSGSSSSTAASFPRSTYALWMMRDLSVIGSSFLLPDIVSPMLVEHQGMDKDRAHNICQIGLPVLAQFIAGPFQYLGLDMYNRNLKGMTTSQATFDRTRQLYQGVAPVIAARIARIIPGYSIGGVANTKLRTTWRESLIERDVAAMMKNNTGTTIKQNTIQNKDYAKRLVASLHGGGDNNNKTSSRQ
ncbi:hypothetical protein FRACYDRAFT_263301 [Fragilariopsis cylindrus CCMP1102]|uniref:Uncharacterized protein n=1 Tax=Fragilariopsis cylindrus CCMP1102 TaxID=635003 RepID=A0A1E7F0Z7_9STRA|nr:hypothetical protein FRACYDRAFT_263301 [Fragilariopsis cylindrus CCMP1102]|eukprot:OEU11735.1 hypothetical protein FRACYDRAFT_263301 [Fragilariopsis cylindrus CCMP1102]